MGKRARESNQTIVRLRRPPTGASLDYLDVVEPEKQLRSEGRDAELVELMKAVRVQLRRKRSARSSRPHRFTQSKQLRRAKRWAHCRKFTCSFTDLTWPFVDMAPQITGVSGSPTCALDYRGMHQPTQT